jgi:flagellar hook-length control protein FliK
VIVAPGVPVVVAPLPVLVLTLDVAGGTAGPAGDVLGDEEHVALEAGEADAAGALMGSSVKGKTGDPLAIAQQPDAPPQASETLFQVPGTAVARESAGPAVGEVGLPVGATTQNLSSNPNTAAAGRARETKDSAASAAMARLSAEIGLTQGTAEPSVVHAAGEQESRHGGGSADANDSASPNGWSRGESAAFAIATAAASGHGATMANAPGALHMAAAALSGASQQLSSGLEPLPSGTVSQIVQSMRLQWSRGAGEARIRLDPAQYGDMTVSLRVEAGQVVAKVQADTALVRDWLHSNQGWLRQSLADQGLTLGRLEVAASAAEEPDEHSRRDQAASSREQQQPPPPRQRRSASAGIFEVVA